MKTVWNPEHRLELRARLGRLTPDTPRQWGTMSPLRMVTHLVDSLRSTMGEVEIPPVKLPIRFPPIKQLIIYVLPFGKNAPSPPQLTTRPPVDWQTECDTLCALMDKFAARDPHGVWPDHPALGRFSGRTWGIWVHRHMDHHFRQFGV